MFENSFKIIDDALWKDAGCDSELDYIEQTSWVLFLKYFHDLELEKADEAELQGYEYEYILEEEYRWNSWAYPIATNGELDHNAALTGPDLIDFVNDKLFPYLRRYRQEHIDNHQSIEYKVGEIFSELKNKMHSGYVLRDVIDEINKLSFLSAEDKHELSHLYETKIKNMGNAGRNGGQYYTPRPLIRTMIQVTNPKIGETIYDPAVGSAGFLCEAYGYIYERMEKSTENLKKLHENTFYR